MIGALYFGEYLSAGLSTYTPDNFSMVGYLGGAVPSILANSVTVSLSATGQSTAAFTEIDTRPIPFTPFRLGVGSLAPANLVFNGEIQVSAQTYAAGSLVTQWPVTAIDSSAQFNRHLVFASFTNVAADVAAKALLAAYAPDFTGIHIPSGLAAITLSWTGETLDTVFAAIAQAIGGYYYRDLSYDVHLFVTETPAMTPDTLDANNATLLRDQPFNWSADTSQTRNRALGIGASTSVLGAGLSTVVSPATPTSAAIVASAVVLPGDTVVPLQDVSMFSATGGKALIGSNIVSYGSKTQANPSTMLAPVIGLTGSLTLGSHQISYTFVTGAGESLPAPLSPAFVAQVYTPQTPPNAPALATSSGYNFDPAGPGTTPGATYVFRAQCIASFGAYSTWSAASAGIVALPSINNPAIIAPISVDITGLSLDPFIAQIQLFVSVNGGAFNPAGFYNGGAGGPGTDIPITYAGSTGGLAYSGPISKSIQTASFALPIGPAGTTARKVYMTPVANPTQLQLQQTVGDNTTALASASTADASLGANAPVTDTSGLVLNAVTTTSGSTAVGATVMNLVSGTNFVSTGGWVVVAGNTIRYTGRTTNQLTGIPSSGVGSVLAAIPSGTQVTNTVALTGIPASGTGSIATAIPSGASCALFSQRDNLTSQALVAAIEGLNATGIQSDGIYEIKITDSSQTTQAGLDALCDADLLLYASALGVITVTYTTLDTKSYPGRPVTINMFGLVGTFIIQAVSIAVTDNVRPFYTCTASSVRYTLDDLLRHVVLH